MGEPEGKVSLEVRTYGREGNIKMCFEEIGWDDVDWINLAEDWDRCRSVSNTVISRVA